MSPAGSRRLVRWPLVGAIAVLALCGCSIFNRSSGTDKAADKRAAQVQQLQLKVMRFADVYAGGVIDPTRKLQAATDDPQERLAAQNWKLSQCTAAYTIASGPNPVANALDMVVLATLSRMVMENAWVRGRYGERAVPLRDVHRSLESDAKALLADVLAPAQTAELEDLINDWRARNPEVRDVTLVRFADFAKSTGPSGAGESKSKGGLFQLIGLDPLSNLDPAVRELAQSRQLAERTIYYAQRLPNLLDMQVELLTYKIAVMPEMQRMLADADHLGGAAASAGRLADDLPNVLAREREAAIGQFTDAINAQTAQMRRLAIELRGTLEAGTTTSNSLNVTIRSFDQLMGRFDKKKPPGASPGRAFDITEYTAAAAEFARTADELQQLVAGIERGGPALAQSADRAAADLQNVIDHALWRLALLGLLLLAGGLVTALAYRGIARRWLA